MDDRERAIGLYTFLQEFAQLRTRPVRDVATYARQGAVIWASDIPRERGCECIAWHRPTAAGDDDDELDVVDRASSAETWLKVRRPRVTPPPAPPESLADWARQDQIEDSSLDIPEPSTTIPAEAEDDPPLRIEDHPEVQAAWDEWVQYHWWPWAERDRREQAVLRVYADLFAMRQRQQALGEEYEAVFGLGLLSWRPPDGRAAVRRHLVTARVGIELDQETGELTVIPDAEGARPELERDMLEQQDHLESAVLAQLERELEGIGEALWEAGPVDGLLRAWVNETSPDGAYDESLDQPEAPTSVPVVHFAPALILRRRTEHSFVRAFDMIAKLLEDGAPVPAGVLRFIGEEEVPNGDSGHPEGPIDGTGDPELYFPLAASDAQRKIVQRLSANRGVLVQGPPGTGKSHTIVNLISHALATGQRVLVTSHAPRALRVLSAMIRDHAPTIAPLAVVLPGSSREALTEMEASVQGILDRQASWDREESQAEIERLGNYLDQARRNESRTLDDLRALRERETYRHDDRYGYSGTLARIAEVLNGEREALGWVPNEIDDGADPPLTEAAFAELVSLLRSADVARWEEGGWDPVQIDGLPDADAFDGAVADERAARERDKEAASIRERAGYAALEALPADQRRNLASGLGELARALDRIDRHPMPWTGAAATEIVGGADQAWRQLHADTQAAAEVVAEEAGWLDAHPITPEPTDPAALRADAAALLAHLEAGGGWGFWVFRAEAVKRALHVREVRVGGQRCDTAEAVRNLVRRLDGELECDRMRERWARRHEFTSATFADLAAELRDICSPVNDALEAASVRQRLMWITAFAPDAPEPVWADRAALLRLRETLDAIDAAERYERARGRLDAWLRDVTGQRRLGIDPTLGELAEAVLARDPDAYAGARRRALANIELAARLSRRRSLFSTVAASAPGLAAQIADTYGHAVWDERVQAFERAWDWRRAHAWITRMTSPDEERRLRLDLDRAKQAIASAIEQLAAERAWNHSLDRMEDRERGSLSAWRQAVLRAGQGKGRYAAQHQRDAREHLNASRSAIPAWVMPLHRVAETMEPGREPLFDIAIIDEASQSGPEALLLAWLARRVVVVGDDEQISPTDAGVAVAAVNGLREQHLWDIPFADAYGARGGSFFDLADIFFGQRIRLREHFRCMPEIIQFSNQLSYASQPLHPLRQYGADRLDPVLARHVPDGYQLGTAGAATNPPEAEAIAEEIVRMCADPAYDGKTMGVISLLGGAQARAIEERLVVDLGPEEMERRRIVCGDAYAFQGDERDVMLLSLVSAPDEERRVRALTDRAARQRFNVAASRARDQMVLFHTATLNDLSPRADCVRRRLLEYCLDPRVGLSGASGLDIAELERSAAQTQREIRNQPPPFESWFELDVFLHIVRRGYRVTPQHKVLDYHIDLVIWGMEGALAVECDGDYWHGPDSYARDLARQREIEGFGWTLERVKEGAFKLEPDAALDDVWAALKRLGIFPGGGLSDGLHDGD